MDEGHGSDGRHDAPSPRAGGELSLAELATASGVPPRTIRYYISRGLLPGPLRRGRHAAYGPGHLARLGEIRRLRENGHTLAEIRRLLAGEPGRAGGGPAPSLPDPVPWWHLELAPDLRVQVRGDVSPWRLREIRAALAELAARLGPGPGAPPAPPPSGNDQQDQQEETP